MENSIAKVLVTKKDRFTPWIQSQPAYGLLSQFFSVTESQSLKTLSKKIATVEASEFGLRVPFAETVTVTRTKFMVGKDDVAPWLAKYIAAMDRHFPMLTDFTCKFPDSLESDKVEALTALWERLEGKRLVKLKVESLDDIVNAVSLRGIFDNCPSLVSLTLSDAEQNCWDAIVAAGRSLLHVHVESPIESKAAATLLQWDRLPKLLSLTFEYDQETLSADVVRSVLAKATSLTALAFHQHGYFRVDDDDDVGEEVVEARAQESWGPLWESFPAGLQTIDVYMSTWDDVTTVDIKVWERSTRHLKDVRSLSGQWARSWPIETAVAMAKRWPNLTALESDDTFAENDWFAILEHKEQLWPRLTAVSLPDSISDVPRLIAMLEQRPLLCVANSVTLKQTELKTLSNRRLVDFHKGQQLVIQRLVLANVWQWRDATQHAAKTRIELFDSIQPFELKSSELKQLTTPYPKWGFGPGILINVDAAAWSHIETVFKAGAVREFPSLSFARAVVDWMFMPDLGNFTVSFTSQNDCKMDAVDSIMNGLRLNRKFKSVTVWLRLETGVRATLLAKSQTWPGLDITVRYARVDGSVELYVRRI